jgi:hypothetical protein
MFKSEDLSLTFSEMFPQNLPSPSPIGRGRELLKKFQISLDRINLILGSKGLIIF